MALEQDSNGFLVGTVISDIKRSRKNSDALLIQVQKIADLLKQQGHLQSGNADNSSSNANANTGSQQGSQGQNQQNNSGGSSNSNQSESSNSESSELSENNEQPAQQRRESLRQKRERQRRERQQQRLSQQEQQADSQADLSQNPPTPSDNLDSEQPSNSDSPSPRQRDANGRFTSEADNDSPESIIAGGDDAARGRDSRGRFSGGGAGGSGGRVDLEKDDSEGGGGLGGLIGGLGDRITSAITAGQELQDVDPTIKAFQEVAEPLQRGYQFIFAGSSKKDKPYFAWFGKIWKSLKDINKNTAENADGENGGSFFSNIAGFLLPIAVTILGFISPIFLGISAAAVVAWGLFTKSGREFFMNLGSNIASAWQWSVNAFSQYIIPALIATWDASVKAFNEQIVPALSASWDWFTQQATETWSGLTDWLSTELPSIVSGAWDSITGLVSDQWGEVLKGLQPVFDAIGDTWDSFMESAKGGWDALINTFTSLYNGLKELPVIGDAIQAAETAVKVATEAAESAKKAVESTTSTIIDNVKSSYNSTVDTVSRVGGDAIDSAKSGYDKTVDMVSRKGEGAVNTVKDAHAKAVDWTSKNVVEPVANIPKSVSARWEDAKGHLKGAADKAGVDSGILAKIANFESGFNSEAMPIVKKTGKKLSSAHGYGQFLDGTWTETLNKYGDKYGVDTGGGKLSKSDAEKYRHDKDLQANMLAEFTKENVEKGRKLGGGDDAANVYAFHNLGGGDASKFLKELKNNPNAPVNSVLSGKVISGNQSLYGSGNITVAEAYKNMGSAMNRGESFAQDIRKDTATEQIASATPQRTVLATPEQVQNAMPKAVQPVSAMPSIASISPIPSVTNQSAKMPEMPSLVLPLSNNVKSSPTTIIPDVGQTVSDQHIAMIAFPYATSMGNNK